MATEKVSMEEDTEMAECDEEQVVTMMDVLKEQQEFEEDANAVLGASDDKNCTFSKGYVKRQAVYACLTCCTDAKFDPTKRAGVCLACSLNCHENHELVELYTKRNFRCDCGNPKFNSYPCQFATIKNELNEDNEYNQNFSGLYCICHRPYPDPENSIEDEMIQCIVCEDWLHTSHLGATVPNNDQYTEMICKACMDRNDFLHDYGCFAVNANLDDVDVDDRDKEKDSDTSKDCNGSLSVDPTEINNEEETGTQVTSNADNVTENNKQNDDSHKNSENTNGNSTESCKDELTSKITETTENASENINSENLNNKTDDVQREIKPDIISTSTVPEDTPLTDDTDMNDMSEPEKNDLSNVTDLGNLNQKEVSISDNTVEKDVSTEVNNCNETVENVQPETIHSETPEIKTTEEIVQTVESSHDIAKNDEKPTPNETQNNHVNEKINVDHEQCENNESTGNEVGTSMNTEDNSSEQKTVDKEPNTDLPTNNSTETVLTATDNENIRDVSKLSEESATIEPEQKINDQEKETIDPAIENTNSLSADIEELKNDINTDNTTTDNDINSQAPNNNDQTKDTPNVNGADDTEQDHGENVKTTDVEMNENLSEKTDIATPVVTGTNSIGENKDNKENKQNDEDEKSLEKKRKLTIDDDMEEVQTQKKPKINDVVQHCQRPKRVKKFKGATFWSLNFRQKLCTCNECITMYKDLAVLFLIDPEDTVTAYEALGEANADGNPSSQYEQGLQALSSLDRIQQINALTEYNKMRDKLLDFLKSFKEKKEIVKEEDIKAFFAGMKPRKEHDGVYFCQ